MTSDCAQPVNRPSKQTHIPIPIKTLCSHHGRVCMN